MEHKRSRGDAQMSQIVPDVGTGHGHQVLKLENFLDTRRKPGAIARSTVVQWREAGRTPIAWSASRKVAAKDPLNGRNRQVIARVRAGLDVRWNALIWGVRASA